MKLNLPHALLIAMEHAFGESSSAIGELKAALGRELGTARGSVVLELGDDLVQRIDASVDGLEKRPWLPPYFGPLTAREIHEQWRTAVKAAETATA